MSFARFIKTHYPLTHSSKTKESPEKVRYLLWHTIGSTVYEDMFFYLEDRDESTVFYRSDYTESVFSQSRYAERRLFIREDEWLTRIKNTGAAA